MTAGGRGCAKESDDQRRHFTPSSDLPVLHTRGVKRTAQETLYVVENGLRLIVHSLGLNAEQDCNPIDVVLASSDQDAQLMKDNHELCSVADTYEQQFVMRWLLDVASQRWWDACQPQSSNTEEFFDEDQQHTQACIETTVDEACRLTAIMAGQSASGNVQSAYRFHFGTAPQQAVVTRINEAAIVQDGLGARTWGAAPFLAAYMTDAQTGPNLSQYRNVLELGAGTGLVGLTIANFFNQRTTSDNTTSGKQDQFADAKRIVHLTDYHDDVLRNLAKNATLNSTLKNRFNNNGSVKVNTCKLDWQNLPASSEAGMMGLCETYDCIVAADCVYEADHALWLFNVARRFLAKPDVNVERFPETTPRMFLLSSLRSLSHGKDVDAIYNHFTSHDKAQELNNSNNHNYKSQWKLFITDESLFVAHQTDNFGPRSLNLAFQKSSSKLSASRHRLTNHAPSEQLFSLVSSENPLYRLCTIEWRLFHKENTL